jgi:hypothetical protein
MDENQRRESLWEDGTQEKAERETGHILGVREEIPRDDLTHLNTCHGVTWHQE